MRLFVFLPALVLLMFGSARAQLREVEDRIVEYVDAHNDEALVLLERTVNVNSGTMNLDGVREVGRMFRDELDDLGFETQWMDGAEWNRAGHLVARREGPGPAMVLIGHLDTVFEPDSPFQRFERVDEAAARGPGVIDMKGGIVIIVQALKALQSAHVLDDAHLTVVLIGDEEKSGRPLSRAREDLVLAAENAEIALGFEDGDGNPGTAVISRRGWTGWTLRVEGRPAHSSQVFADDVGAGAIFEASRVLAAFYEELRGEEFLTFNPGIFLGGTGVEYAPERDGGSAAGKLNIVAEHAVVPGDLRALSIEQRERAKEAMRRIVESGLPQTTSRIEFDDSYPPMAPTAGNRMLLQIYDEVSRDLGFGPVEAVDPRDAGAADISFAAEHVSMAIDGLGLMGTGGHTLNETANLQTLPSQTARAAVLIHRLSQRR